ncbi:MAG: GNAT family N-acetyltransferase [Oscillospiraceae bacterium]|nr:GNAT family N-acetyltransferase [Oscillospiraceae bacterium]
MKLSPIFASHMVFAAGKPVRVFGTGKGKVTVSLAGVSRSAVSEGEEWLVELPPMDHGGPYLLTVAMNEETVVFEDVHIGEVILFAGQSNMQFKLRESPVPAEKWQSEPRLRLFSTERSDHRPEKQDTFQPADGWVSCTAENAGNWSAIAYQTGLMLTARKDVAVGAIACYQGASVIETWVPAGTFEANGISLSPEEKHPDHFHEDFGRWNGDGFLYEKMFSQVRPFSVNAVAWYQGESDTTTGEGEVYADELCLLIDRWRADLMDEKLPFVVVQIADYDPRPDEGWKLVQQAQLKVREMRPAVRTVVSADVCESDDIHPPTKELLALRIAGALSELTAMDTPFAEKGKTALKRLHAGDMKTLTRWLTDDRVTRWVWAEGVPWDLEKVTEEFSDMLDPAQPQTAAIVLHEGKEIGYLQFYPLEPDAYKIGADTFAELKGGYGTDFFIGVPELWEKGIGSEVIALLAEYLRGQGVPLLTADPAMDNPRSLHFWQKNGFAPLCEVEDYDAPEKTGLLCVKRL